MGPTVDVNQSALSSKACACGRVELALKTAEFLQGISSKCNKTNCLVMQTSSFALVAVTVFILITSKTH